MLCVRVRAVKTITQVDAAMLTKLKADRMALMEKQRVEQQMAAVAAHVQAMQQQQQQMQMHQHGVTHFGGVQQALPQQHVPAVPQARAAGAGDGEGYEVGKDEGDEEYEIGECHLICAAGGARG